MTDLTLFELALAFIALFTLATLLVTLWRFATLRYPYDDGDACDLADLLVWANARARGVSDPADTAPLCAPAARYAVWWDGWL